MQGRKSLKLRHRRKDKEKEKLPSGITADYSANFFADLNRDLLVESPNGQTPKSASDYPVAEKFEANNAVTTTPPIVVSYISSPIQTSSIQPALPLPPLPPRFTKKPVSTIASKSVTNRRSPNVPVVESNIDDFSLSSTGCCAVTRTAAQEDVTDFSRVHSNEEVDDASRQVTSSIFTLNFDKGDDKSEKCLSVESLTDSTTNSSFATPPFSSSPVGEGQGLYSKFADLTSLNSLPDDVAAATAFEFPLPEIESTDRLVKSRQLVISRPTCKSDFGFSVRRVMTVDRTSGVPQLRSVILAELNTASSGLGVNYKKVGLLPGDHLLEVNGISVNDSTREEIIEMIKLCDTSVAIKVITYFVLVII